VIRGLLRGVVRIYRRFISGRGPLARIRCSFPEETCSAFGLRALDEAPSTRAAIARIARRMRRCRDACLIVGPGAVSWTALHDQPPAEIVAELTADGERADAIARILAVRRAVAILRGDVAAAGECGAPLDPPRVVPRAGRASVARRRAGLLAVLAGVTSLAWWPLGLALAIPAAFATRAAWREHARFTLHATWAARRHGTSEGTGIACPPNARATK
jgi:putative component of membrane protein insertase Oxa1/YidC/SpoIIIJ protein YidD